MDRHPDAPTVVTRGLQSRGIEIAIEDGSKAAVASRPTDAAAWREFRLQLLLFAFAGRGVTLVCTDSKLCSSLSVPIDRSARIRFDSPMQHFARSPDRAEGGDVDLNDSAMPTISGIYGSDHGDAFELDVGGLGRQYVIHWSKCSAETLRAIARDDSFELNFAFLTSIDDSIPERLATLLNACNVDFGAVPITKEELIHCTGDSDGHRVWWLNPRFNDTMIVEYLFRLSQRFGWGFHDEKLDIRGQTGDSNNTGERGDVSHG